MKLVPKLPQSALVLKQTIVSFLFLPLQFVYLNIFASLLLDYYILENKYEGILFY